MTFFGKLITFFPVLVITLIVATVIGFILDPSLFMGLCIVFAIYGFPLVCFHIHQYFCPLKEGTHDITKGYCPWYGTYMIQNIYITFPSFERLLRLIPGAFSAWLRLWGSNVGNNVYWTSQLEVFDRSLVEIGENCVFGFDVMMSSHMVRPSSKYGMVVYVKRITLGKNVFIGAATRMTPGVTIEEGSMVPPRSDLYPNTKITKKARVSNVTQSEAEKVEAV